MSLHHSTSLVLSILLTFSASIHCSAAQNNEVAASTVYIVPESDSETPTSSCPGDPCLTIDQYVSNSSLRNGILDITLELQPGYHNLSIPFNISSDVLSIAMIGTGRDVTLLCTQEFSFNFISSVRIRGINLVNCGGTSTHIRSVQNFTLEDSTFTSDMPFRLRFVMYPVISNSIFSNCTSGALLITFGEPMISNCTFSNNVKRRMLGDTDGGVINFVSVSATVDRCIFENNRAMFTSGAIYFTGGSVSVIRNSYFFNNSAIEGSGGAVYSIDGSLIIEDSSFTNNNAGDHGGALYLLGQANTFSIERCTFLNNTARFEGGAVSLSHRNSNLNLFLHSAIDSSRFEGNSAGRGGAVFKRGGNIGFNVLRSSFVNNTSSNNEFASGAVYILSGKSQIAVILSEFVRNSGADGAMHIDGRDYSATVQDSIFTENFATVSGGALSSTSLNGNFTIRGSEFYRNSAPQCGAVDLKSDDMNPNFQTRNGLKVQVLDSSFANNAASVGGGGAICASAISISISGFDSASIGTFRQNSAVTGGGAISTINSVLTISGASFSDNTARSGGDAIHACSSEVTVESSDGLSSGNMAGQCLLFGNGGVSNYVINLPLILFVMLVTLIMY